MIKKILHSSLILFAFVTSIYAQSNYSISQFADESFQFIKQPAKWESSDWLKFGLVSAGTILIMQADKPIRDNVLKDQRYYKSFPIEAGRIWGEGYPTVLLAAAFGMHGLIAKDKSTQKIGFEIVQSAIYAGAITSVLKVVIGKARPFTNKGNTTYNPISILNDDYHSLPSGHVTLAFSLSTVLAKNTRSDLSKIILYLPAILTAVSRVYQDNHWASDVFLGAAIGYFVGDWATNLHEQKNDDTQLSLFPFSIRIPIH